MPLKTLDRTVSNLGYIAIALVLGFLFGERLGSFFDSGEPSLFYQTIVKGRVGIQSASIDGSCPTWPNDNIYLDAPIVTDGKTRGFALGGTDLYESDMKPNESDGLCYYGNEFDVLLSRTGVYELSFPELSEVAGAQISFRAEPKPFWGLDTRSVEADSVWWYFTTIDCPDSTDLCLRDDR
jgi:hypothetical protein